MKTSLAVRSAVASTLALACTLAVASEAAVEGQGELQGTAALFYLLGGVGGLGVVIWLMVKFLGREKK
jgi:hypothetical protein